MKRSAVSTWGMTGSLVLVASIASLVPARGAWGAVPATDVLEWAGVVAGQATAQAQPAGSPSVEITKVCPNLRYLNREATFEITVANRGSGAAHNVVVTDTLTGALEFISADNKGTHQGNQLVWSLGTLDAGQSRTLKANFRCSQIGTVQNTAMVTYCAEANTGCQMEVKGIPAILLECVDDPDPIEVGGSVNYTITVTNQGSAMGTNIVVTCTLPAEEEYVTASGPTNPTAAGKTVTFAPLASLAPKARAVYTLTAKGVGEGDVRFGVQLQSDQMDSPVNETESTHFYK